jgi:hypothetical protein
MATRDHVTAVAPVSTVLSTGRPRKRLPTEAMDNMPPALFAAIGELLARWGYLQFQLGVVIRLALGMTREAQLLLLQRADIDVLCEQMKNIAASDHWISDADLRKRIKDLQSKVKKERTDRNVFAHAVLGYADEDDAFVIYRFSKTGGHVEKAPLDEGNIRAQALVARALWAEAQEITKALKLLRRPK